FGDLSQPTVTSVPEVHRALQQRYVDLLAHVMLRPDPGTPLDAGALARHHLNALAAQLDRALARGDYDESTTANLEDLRERVARSLAATTVVPAP
ncbi:MAG TPA: hypothetical protein VEJ20_09870, partial [Candidatus Eremiobacteraceae bacterium]|nr:hypothetical protein [Candidatus Eremiobacteraceae bacterium]